MKLDKLIATIGLFWLVLCIVLMGSVGAVLAVWKMIQMF